MPEPHYKTQGGNCSSPAHRCVGMDAAVALVSSGGIGDKTTQVMSEAHYNICNVRSTLQDLPSPSFLVQTENIPVVYNEHQIAMHNFHMTQYICMKIS